jgi:hypothetical protein
MISVKIIIKIFIKNIKSITKKIYTNINKNKNYIIDRFTKNLALEKKKIFILFLFSPT